METFLPPFLQSMYHAVDHPRPELVLALLNLQQKGRGLRTILKLAKDDKFTNRQASRAWCYAILDFQKMAEAWPDYINNLQTKDRMEFLHHIVTVKLRLNQIFRATWVGAAEGMSLYGISMNIRDEYIAQMRKKNPKFELAPEDDLEVVDRELLAEVKEDLAELKGYRGGKLVDSEEPKRTLKQAALTLTKQSEILQRTSKKLFDLMVEG